MADPCIHEQDFGIMKTQIKAINKVLFENGMQKQVIELNLNLKNQVKLDEDRKESDKELRVSVQDLRTVVSGFDTFQKEEKAKEKIIKTIEHEREQTKRYKLGLFIASILSFASVFIAYLSYLKT